MWHVVELGTGVFALIDPEPAYGHSNVGLVVDADGLTVIDTTATPATGQEVRRLVDELTSELDLRLKRVLLTSSRVVVTGGSSAFWPAAVYGSEPTSEALDRPIDPRPLRRLFPQFADQYLEELPTVPVSHEVADQAWLTDSTAVSPVVGDDDGPGVVAEVPGAGVIFAGAIASFGTTPLAFTADLEAWADTCEALAETTALVVPAHGPVGGSEQLLAQAAYLRACVDADGDPGAVPPGPWDDWSDRRFDVVNVERAARLRRGDPGVPRSFLALLGLT